MAYTADDIITWAKISQPLAAIGEYKKRATSTAAVDVDHHIKLYVERKSVEWYNDQTNIDADYLYKIANWLWALSMPYGLEAQFIDGGSGGIVTPVTPASTTLPEPIDWEVTSTASGTAPLADGESSVLLNGTNGMPNLVGYNVEFTRGGSTQNTTNIGASYYTWNRNSGLFTCSPAATLTELFRILPTR